MPLLVMKFGGTSVATLDRIRRAAKRVGREVANGYDVIVIVSAMAGKTNELVGWVEETTWDIPAATATVAFVPTQGAALIKAHAEIAVVADGEEAVRRVTGELKVRIPLLGGRVENAIVDGIGDHLTEEAEVVAARIEG